LPRCLIPGYRAPSRRTVTGNRTCSSPLWCQSDRNDRALCFRRARHAA
jgi:hypothetical protein